MYDKKHTNERERTGTNECVPSTPSSRGVAGTAGASPIGGGGVLGMGGAPDNSSTALAGAGAFSLLL